MTEVASFSIDEPVALHIAFQVVLVTMLQFNQLLRQRGLLSTPDNVRIGHESVAANDAIAMRLQIENLASAPSSTLHDVRRRKKQGAVAAPET